MIFLKVTIQYSFVTLHYGTLLELLRQMPVNFLIEGHNHDSRCPKIQTMRQSSSWEILDKTKMNGILVKRLYHMGVPVEDIPELAATGARTVPVMTLLFSCLVRPETALMSCLRER